MAEAPAKGKKGSGLGKKVGPLPLWAWALGSAILLYVAYRYMSGQSGSGGAAQQTQTVSSQTPSDATGLASQPGAPADSGQLTSDYLAALGSQQGSLLQSFEAQNQDVLALAEAQLSAAAGNPAVSPSSTSETQPVGGSQPGGSNAPTIYYVSPQALNPTGSKPAATTTVAKPKQTVVSRYYTYKRDVPLGPGQTVHFLSGRGYFAV